MTAKITPGQRKQISRFLEDGIDALDLTKEDAQRVISMGGVLHFILKTGIDQLIKVVKFPSYAIAAELIPEYTDKGGGKKKWEIVEDVTPSKSKFEVKDLELVSFLKSGENYVPGETMHRRAHDLKANLGLADAKYVLDHSAEIPPEFRDKYLVFPSTLLRDSYGRLYVAYLCWDGSRWCLDFGWLGREWHDGEHLVRCK